MTDLAHSTLTVPRSIPIFFHRNNPEKIFLAMTSTRPLKAFLNMHIKKLDAPHFLHYFVVNDKHTNTKSAAIIKTSISLVLIISTLINTLFIAWKHRSRSKYCWMKFREGLVRFKKKNCLMFHFPLITEFHFKYRKDKQLLRF